MSTHGTYDDTGGRPLLRFERRLEHPVDLVWRAITDPAELAHWFPTEVRGDLTPGATLTFTFPGDDQAHHGEVVEADPPRVLAFTWFGDLLRFELEPAGDDATTLRFTQKIAEVDAAARTMAGWTVCLDRLEARLAGRPATAPGPEATAEWQAHYGHYVDSGVPSGAPVPGQH
jgi:uncharacterized protein YndB with AHSA1/START domain